MRNSNNQSDRTADLHSPRATRQRWQKMRVQYVGHISEILRGGGGKMTAIAGDPGEARKQKGGGGG
jgi:hypothetical protein